MNSLEAFITLQFAYNGITQQQMQRMQQNSIFYFDDFNYIFHDCALLFPCRKSEDTAGGTDSKIARKEHSNIIKINKKPASLESINRGINSTLPTLESKTGHENNSVNKTAKPKVVKLNRKTLGLNLNKSVEEQTLKQELQLSLNGGTQKVITRYYQKWCFYTRKLT